MRFDTDKKLKYDQFGDSDGNQSRGFGGFGNGFGGFDFHSKNKTTTKSWFKHDPNFKIDT
jgi:DnaJ-class molecular chaperone